MHTIMWTYDELRHHGILGQKWGVRRFQNKDGSLTEAGKKRYSLGDFSSDMREIRRQATEMRVNRKYGNYSRNRWVNEMSLGLSPRQQISTAWGKRAVNKALDGAMGKYNVVYDGAQDKYIITEKRGDA